MFARILLVLLVAVVAWAVVVRPSEGARGERVYVVRPADTLWSIAAARYAGDTRKAVWEIRRRNALDGSALRPGQRLTLP